MGWVAIPVANLQVYIHYISTVDYIYIYITLVQNCKVNVETFSTMTDLKYLARSRSNIDMRGLGEPILQLCQAPSVLYFWFGSLGVKTWELLA